MVPSWVIDLFISPTTSPLLLRISIEFSLHFMIKLMQPNAHSSVSDAEPLRDLPKAVSLTFQSHEFILTYDSVRTTKLFPTCAGVPNTRANSLSDQIALKLSDSRNDCEQRLP